MGLRALCGALPPRIPYWTEAVPVESLPLPPKATLLWREASPDDVGVAVGDSVQTGQNLAREGAGLFISTVTGTVEEINSLQGADAVEYAVVGIKTLEVESYDSSMKSIEDLANASPEQILSMIVRAGFPGFDTLVNPIPQGATVETLIVSALDQEPLTAVNPQVLHEHADDVSVGIAMLSRATGAKKVVVAIPHNSAHSADGISVDQTEIVKVQAIYPNGLPEILAKKQGGGLLLKTDRNGTVGNTLVVSIEHLVGMVSCLREGRPFVNKIVTCCGKSGGELKNILVRIGTPVSMALENLDVKLPPGGKLIINGPMHGYTCFSDEQPMTATSDSILVQNPAEVHRFESTACINCGRCSAVCPEKLEVNLLGRFSEYGIFDKCAELGVENCIECGLCVYVCPAQRPLLHLLAHAKLVVKEETAQK